MDCIQGTQRRLIESSGSSEKRAIDRQQSDCVEEFTASGQ